jgi:predicted transcriptional regulator
MKEDKVFKLEDCPYYKYYSPVANKLAECIYSGPPFYQFDYDYEKHDKTELQKCLRKHFNLGSGTHEICARLLKIAHKNKDYKSPIAKIVLEIEDELMENEFFLQA